MGVGLVPFYDPQVPTSALYDGDGKGLAEEFPVLESIAADAGLPPLSHFADEGMEDDEFDASQGGTDLTYRAILDVLPIVEGLIREIRTKPQLASQLMNLLTRLTN
jgi:hypothetical protein